MRRLPAAQPQLAEASWFPEVLSIFSGDPVLNSQSLRNDFLQGQKEPHRVDLEPVRQDPQVADPLARE
jgi:hypothetical protein